MKYHPKASDYLTTQYPPCAYCQHVRQVGTLFSEYHIKTSLRGWTCLAYPEGIPYHILRKYNDHLHIAAGQVGDYMFKSERLHTGQGETGWQYITWDGKFVDAPYLKGENNGQEED